jgi:hypothetical protein
VAVLVVFRTEGDPEELLARYDQTLVDAVSTAPARPEAHYCVATESGMMIVDVWASRADLQLRAVIETRTSRRNGARLGGQKRLMKFSSSITRDGPPELSSGAAHGWDLCEAQENPPPAVLQHWRSSRLSSPPDASRSASSFWELGRCLCRLTVDNWSVGDRS